MQRNTLALIGVLHSHTFRPAHASHRMLNSMGRNWNGWDNAPVECL